jgi:hypothetical protein
MKKTRVASVTLLALSATCAGFGLRSVLADGAPTGNPLYYAGTLIESGQPVDGNRSITINLWPNATPTSGESVLCATSLASVPVVGGRFRVALDSTCTGAVSAHPDVYIEIIENGVTLGRSKIGAVPYAIEANHAVAASNATHATSADSATQATSASSATHASTADSANHASSADSATNATTCTNATTATTCTNATNATNCTNATNATNCTTASSAASASVATAVAAASVRIEQTNCAQQNVGTGGAGYGNVYTDCTCHSNEVAVSGGAFAGNQTNWIDDSENGVVGGGSMSTWRVACVDKASGYRVPCTSPFAVCVGVQ